MWSPIAGEEEKDTLFALWSANQRRSHHLSPLRCRTEMQRMASGAAPDSRLGWPRFGPGAYSCALPWIAGGKVRLWDTPSEGKAPAGGSARPELPDPVPYPDQHAQGHAYRDTPADLHINGYSNGHTYSDGNGHTY